LLITEKLIIVDKIILNATIFYIFVFVLQSIKDYSQNHYFKACF
jgi:hypothetical protein